MRRIFRDLLGVIAAVVVFSALVPAQPALAAVDVYTTEGYHVVNDREWRTTCEPYSQTTRCRTEIKATAVTESRGRFVSTFGWVFNNLTYVESPRSLWAGNPLAAYGVTGGQVTWTSADGRKWRTECDTPTTGGNGCRSYIEARVIESFLDPQGNRRYRWVDTWVFNNLVRFSPGPGNIDLNEVVDPNLRECIKESARGATYLTPAAAAGIRQLYCQERGIRSLEGFPVLPNLWGLVLLSNQISTIAPLPLSKLPSLTSLNLGDNRIASLEGMPPELTKMRGMMLQGNRLTSLQGLPKMPDIRYLALGYNQISLVAPLASYTTLEEIQLRGNPISDLGSLEPLREAGCRIYT